MESLRELFKIGKGPSSSHTMGPERAANIIKKRFGENAEYVVDLYGPFYDGERTSDGLHHP